MPWAVPWDAVGSSGPWWRPPPWCSSGATEEARETGRPEESKASSKTLDLLEDGDELSEATDLWSPGRRLSEGRSPDSRGVPDAVAGRVGPGRPAVPPGVSRTRFCPDSGAPPEPAVVSRAPPEPEVASRAPPSAGRVPPGALGPSVDRTAGPLGPDVDRLPPRSTGEATGRHGPFDVSKPG
ncbi:hypothetical protein ACFV3R_00430 [Streptomyces sp. NPDC059740]|uniref:hypothetical protein n=1 Tax=Streptomyces sp. NPDC059740 TaxID=3346926 RepID=UPI0036478916